MKSVGRFQRYLLLAICVCGLATMGAGCPWLSRAKVVVLFTGDSGAAAKDLLALLLPKGAGPVDVNDIESLTVTITEVALDQEGDENGDTESKSKVVVFEGAVDVNILDLTGVSEILSEANVQAGTYTKIRLEIENPRLVLKAAPETEITDIQLTANGHLFVSETFELEGNETHLIILDFGGIHLVEQGNGRFTLTPQLRADISVTSAEAAVTGEITELDTEADTLVVQGETEVSVDYSAALIFKPEDTDTATGTEADLAVGLEVEIQGTLHVDGTLTAETIHILPAV